MNKNTVFRKFYDIIDNLLKELSDPFKTVSDNIKNDLAKLRDECLYIDKLVKKCEAKLENLNKKHKKEVDEIIKTILDLSNTITDAKNNISNLNAKRKKAPEKRKDFYETMKEPYKIVIQVSRASIDTAVNAVSALDLSGQYILTAQNMLAVPVIDLAYANKFITDLQYKSIINNIDKSIRDLKSIIKADLYEKIYRTISISLKIPTDTISSGFKLAEFSYKFARNKFKDGEDAKIILDMSEDISEFKKSVEITASMLGVAR